MKPSVIVLAGPTAVGKTAVSLRLAEALGAEIVSADSMQVYRGMDIGTAKASPSERARVPHHLIDVADPEENFSLARYVVLARAAVEDILGRKKIPLIVGGTGFYIQALLKGLDFSGEAPDPALREKYRKIAETEGPGALYRLLQEKDPASAEAIHPNNIKRVIRALTVCEESGERLSSVNEAQRAQENIYRTLYFVLTMPRESLYRRIDARVDAMFAEGLEEETRRLLARPLPADSTAVQGLGYKETAEYLAGTLSLEEAAERIKRGSRHYAKRQMTWFRREKDAVWVDKSAFADEDAVYEYLLGRSRAFLAEAE